MHQHLVAHIWRTFRILALESTVAIAPGGLYHGANNGVGLEPAEVERAFNMFRRLHASGKYEGTRMGLAMCRKIVEFHGGRIRVGSEPGKVPVSLFNCPLFRKSNALGWILT